MMTVYLAGGMRSEWRDVVIAGVPGVRFLDPCLSGLKTPADYVQWDLRAIRACDLVFANLELSNPVGFNLTLEIGYAHALGRKVFLVIDPSDPRRGRALSMALEICEVFDTVEAAILRLLAEKPAAPQVLGKEGE